MTDGTAIARRLLAAEPALTSSLDFGPWTAQGTGDGPALIIGDQSEISLLGSAAGSRLDHRMAHLARPGDIVLVRTRDPEFEAYLAGHMGLGGVAFLEADGHASVPVARRALASHALAAALADAARRGGGLTVKPYMATGTSWLLARAIGEAARRTVHVCGPSPRAARRANDKLWFTQLARAVIGNDATPPTLSAYGPAAAAGLAAAIAGRAAQVIVKVPDSAGSAGNVKLDAADIRGRTLADLRRFLSARLHALGWQDTYPVLVGVWDANVACSPSVQTWIPLPGEGPPFSEGVFEQAVAGDVRAFVGAARSTLPRNLQDRLETEALAIARVLQQLGYYGRCSFDAVLCRPDGGREAIHWIECNGRWGGVSIPLALAKGIGGPGIGGFQVIQDRIREVRMTTRDVIGSLRGLLFERGRREEGLILLSPAPSSAGTSVNLLSLAATQDAAARIAAEGLARLRPGG